jgi:hypothetical protein
MKLVKDLVLLKPCLTVIFIIFLKKGLIKAYREGHQRFKNQGIRAFEVEVQFMADWYMHIWV